MPLRRMKWLHRLDLASWP